MNGYFPAEDRDEGMDCRRSGRSDRRLPAVSPGRRQNFGDDRPLENAAVCPAASLRSGCR